MAQQFQDEIEMLTLRIDSIYWDIHSNSNISGQEKSEFNLMLGMIFEQIERHNKEYSQTREYNFTTARPIVRGFEYLDKLHEAMLDKLNNIIKSEKIVELEPTIEPQSWSYTLGKFMAKISSVVALFK